MDGFITLVSDSSVEFFQGNRIGNFRTKLPHPIHVDRNKCEIGLHNITFPNTLPNVEDGSFKIRAYITTLINNPPGPNGEVVDSIPQRELVETRECSIPPGFYKSPQDIVALMNEQIRGMRYRNEDVRRLHKHYGGNLINFSYDEHTEKMSIIHSQEARDDELYSWYAFDVKLSADLFVKLGWGLTEDSRQVLRTPSQAEHTVDLEMGHSCMFVYCDVIEKNRIVGREVADLLSTVPLLGEHNTRSYYEPSNIEYRKCRYETLDEIQISLLGDTGQVLPFLSGKVVLNLHIRQKY